MLVAFCVVSSALVPNAVHQLDVRHSARSRPLICADEIVDGGAQLVWLTGHADLRVQDHGGLTVAAAAEGEGAVVPLFILDDNVHLKYSPIRLARLHRALTSLEAELRDRYDMPLVIRRGDASVVLPKVAAECGAATCHVIEDDVELPMRLAQRSGCAALVEGGVAITRWDNALRAAPPGEGWAGFFPDYCAAASTRSLQAAIGAPEDGDLLRLIEPIASDGLPSLKELVEMAVTAGPPAATSARARPACDTSPPHEALTLELCGAGAARAALDEYVRAGRDAFADARFQKAAGTGAMSAMSLHAIGGERLLNGGANAPSTVLALREAPTRAFSAALGVGALSAREVREAATDAGAGATTSLEGMPIWGRESADSLSDVVEWREWFEVLAKRSLARQDSALPATSGGEKAAGGDRRETGTIGFWRWGGEHLTRYATWPAGDDFVEGSAPALMMVHGFAASLEQWERLVHAMREEGKQMNGGRDMLPPVFAMDIAGFGHSSKPDVSYTQYLWEAHIVDFVLEVMDARDVVLMGNSIGGGLVAGAASYLQGVCKGVVLFNSAGVLVEPGEYDPAAESLRDATLRGNDPKPYAAVPLLGQPALELFGSAIIGLIYPQIEKQLGNIYADRPQNADPALAYAIQQGAKSPGSPNVIGSGQKLAANRPLNEVLGGAHGFGGPVLVVQGLNDRVSGVQRCRERADTMERIGFTVARVADGGHCVQDDAPLESAKAVWAWLPKLAE